MQRVHDPRFAAVYTGRELRPHFILETFGVVGTAVVGWVGPTHVATSELVDWVDRREKETIVAREMAHFIVEMFGASLRETVLFQRLWIARISDLLGSDIEKRGNDLFGPDKLSVSIATASPVSTLIHFGLNLDPSGAPVAATGVYSRGWTPESVRDGLIPKILALAAREWDEVNISCAKVRPVL